MIKNVLLLFIYYYYYFLRLVVRQKYKKLDKMEILE